ncbi:MAG: winged helix-turn-helix domain-containing protein, partial [Blastocatellia bacterium]
FGPFQLNVADRQLKREGEPAQLTPKLFDLLVFLLENSGRAISKDELLNKVWPDSFGSEENLSRHISMLRKALNGESSEQKYIETLPKFGYRFAEPVTLIAETIESVVAKTPSRPNDWSGILPNHDGRLRQSGKVELPGSINQPAMADDDEIPGELYRYELEIGQPISQSKRKSGKLIALAATLIAVAGIAAAIYWWKKGYVETGKLPTIVPFTSFQNRENYPAFSPDDKMLAFTWDGQDGKNTDIYVKLLDAETPLRLTTNPAADISPVWSPDGRFLAFVRLFDDGKAGIYLVPMLGGPERELLSGIWSAGNGVPAGRLAWSPDGKVLVFAGREDQQATNLHLYRYDFDTQQKQRLTDSVEDDRSPVLSPDGKTLAFIRGLDEIYMMPATGGQPRQLTFENRRIFGLAWASNGLELIFSSARAGNPALWKIAATGGKPEALTPGGEQVGNLAVTHRGTRLIYAQSISDSNIWQLEFSGSPASPNSPTVLPTVLIASTRLEVQPESSPDGSSIAYVSARSGRREIWLSDSAGQNQVQLTRFNGPYVGSPKFSPDGKQVAFDCTAKNDQRDIYVIGISGGTPRRLTTDNATESEPFWSRDGQWIYFGSMSGGSEQIWKMPAIGGQAVQITKTGGRQAAESPDGKYLYFSKKPDEPGIWRVPTAGGEEKLILVQGHTGNWAISELGIYLVNPATKPQATLELFSFATNKISTVATLKKWAFTDLTVSPDGHKFLWSQVDRNESDLILVGNFR